MTAEAVSQLTGSGIIREKKRKEQIRAWIPLFGVKKVCKQRKKGKKCLRRLIADGRKINARIGRPEGMRLPSLESFGLSLFGAHHVKRPRWAAAVDFEGWFHQIRWRQSRLGVVVGKKRFVYSRLPMGLNFAPVLANAAACAIAQVPPPASLEAVVSSRRQVCVDDVCVVGESEMEVDAGVSAVKVRAQLAGARLREDKEQRPARRVEFLGVEWSLERGTARLKSGWGAPWARVIAGLLLDRTIRANKAWSLCGALAWWLRVRQLPWAFFPYSFFLYCEAGGREEFEELPFSVETRREWTLWAQALLENDSKTWRPVSPYVPFVLPGKPAMHSFPSWRVEAVVVSDASLSGFGCKLFLPERGEYRLRSSKWGMWSRRHEDSADMFPLEVQATVIAAETWGALLEKRQVLVVGDSSGALLAIRHGRTAHRWAMSGVAKVWRALECVKAWEVGWVPTDKMCCDDLSRGVGTETASGVVEGGRERFDIRMVTHPSEVATGGGENTFVESWV